MSLNKFNIKLISLIISLILLVRVNVYSTVYTTIADGNWTSSSIWSPSKPNMNYGFNDTVYISHQVVLNSNISVHGYFVVQSGAKLSKNNKSISIKEFANFVNNGTVEIKNLTLDWGTNTITNTGNIILHGSFINYEGNLTNTGSISTNSNFKNSWGASTVNNGSVSVGNYFLNSSTYTGNGSLTVLGNFTNDWSSSFSTSGNLDITNNFVNRGTAQMDDKVNVGGKFTNDWSSTLVMTDTVLVTGNVLNRGNFDNSGYLFGDNFTNEGPYSATGDTKFNGNVTNKNSITNSGTFDVSGNYINKWNSTSTTNSGDFIVAGNMTNNGNVVNNGLLYVVGNLNNSSQINNDGNIFVDSSVTGSGNVDGSGTLCNSDGQTDPTGGAKANNVTCTVCDGTTNTLPVKLVAFEVEFVEDTHIDINWRTASEENNDYFEVLHSSNGIDFEVIDRVEGAGNSNTLINYQSSDYNAKQGVNYYQLRQVDFDGKTTLSNIRTVMVNSNNELSLYPNPVNNGQNISVEFKNEMSYTAEVYDVTGRMLMSFEGNTNSFKIATNELIKGNYILRIVNGEQSIVKRFIVN